MKCKQNDVGHCQNTQIWGFEEQTGFIRKQKTDVR